MAQITPKKNQYALRAVFELAKHQGRGPTKICHSADAQAIPARLTRLSLYPATWLLHQIKTAPEAELLERSNPETMPTAPPPPKRRRQRRRRSRGGRGREKKAGGEG